MKKGDKMISGPSVSARLTRFAQVQFLALMSVLGLLVLPALAAADDDSIPSDESAQQPVDPAIEPAQTVDESITPEMIEARFNKFVKSIVDAAHALTKTDIAAAADQNARTAGAAIGAATAVADDDDDPQTTEVSAKQAEIDTINEQIELERARAARRIAELEQQLSDAREELASMTAIDSDGFIKSWLVLGPIRIDEKVNNHDEESNKGFLDREYVPPKQSPKEGDTASIDGADLTWTTAKASDYFVDLAKVADDQQLDSAHAAYLGVVYVTTQEEVTGVRLLIGSDDDSVWRLNGKEVIRAYAGRGVEKDQDTAEDLTLKQGVNVLTFTVLNGEGPTAAAARFVDEDGHPVKGLKVSLTPPQTQKVADTDPENPDDAPGK